MSIIYFSHSTYDYNDGFEKLAIEHIKEEFGKDVIIINPRYIGMHEGDRKKLSGSYHDFLDMMEKYYYVEIGKSDVVVAFKDSKKGKYSNGVLLEIKYARKIGKTVRMVNGVLPAVVCD